VRVSLYDMAVQSMAAKRKKSTRVSKKRLKPRREVTLGAQLFKAHLAAKQQSLRDFSLKLGVSRAQIGMYTSGQSRPSLEQAVEIQKITNHRVQPDSWFSPQVSAPELARLTRGWFTREPKAQKAASKKAAAGRARANKRKANGKAKPLVPIAADSVVTELPPVVAEASE
jgi:transcriptional regulator with XRE-family HTH domain